MVIGGHRSALMADHGGGAGLGVGSHWSKGQRHHDDEARVVVFTVFLLGRSSTST